MDGSGKQGGGEWCITDSETSVCFALWNFTTIPLNLRNIDGLIFVFFLSSEIRQKDQSQKGCFKNTAHTKFSEKRIFLNVRVRIRGGGMFAFLKIWIRFKIRPSASLPTISSCFYFVIFYSMLSNFNSFYFILFYFRTNS